ncbi:MAG TPA: glycosyltransferase family 39 protein [Candidatus Saccharimonadales bacterium]|nr:glycosyltransferase family 39 protein [Candidatus Saccharimonadales bacterium]
MALIVLMAAVELVIHLLTNGGYNVFRDEFYYIACGRHLAWGYVDHPPLVAAVAALSRAWFGDSLRGLRLFPALAGSLTVLLTGLMARDLGGGRFARFLACLGAIVAPVYLGNFTLFTMNAFDLLFWALAAWLLIRILNGGNPRQWLLLGLVAGVGLLNKHSMLFFLGGMFLGLLLTSARRHLRTRWPWLAALIAALLVAPHVAWQVSHGWPTVEFIQRASRLKNFPISPLGFLWGQVLLMQPLTFPVWLAGLGSLLLGFGSRRHRALGLAYLAVFLLLMLTKSKVYYLSPAYPFLLAAGAGALERFSDARGRGWLRPTAAAACLVGGAVLAPLALPLLPPARLEAYMHALRLTPPPEERHRAPRLTQTFADMFGWEEMVAKVARVYHALPPAERARCVLFASNYGEAGAIDYYGPRYGLPPAVSGHNNYFLWGPGDMSGGRGDVVITVGETREDVGHSYREVTEADRTDNEWCMPFENDVPILVGRGPKNRLSEIWWRCKDYI